MRPEHNETKTKTETKNYETETETETSPVKSFAGESNTHGMFHFYYTHEVNDEPEIDFSLKIISEKDVQQ